MKFNDTGQEFFKLHSSKTEMCHYTCLWTSITEESSDAKNCCSSIKNEISLCMFSSKMYFKYSFPYCNQKTLGFSF